MWTRALEISMTNCDSCPALAARSPSIPSTRAGISSSSTDKPHPSNGCRSCPCSSTSITSCTSMSVSCRKRMIWHSSNVQLRSMSYLDLELEVSIQARKSYRSALAWKHMTSCSMRTLPRPLESHQSVLPCGDDTFPAI
jgi:hypothetical protein